MDKQFLLSLPLRMLPMMALCALAHAAPAATADPVAGQALFKTCANCHQVGPAARAGFGPQLNGIIGRAAASTNDYRYSAAMQNSHIVWTEDKLRAFLKAPGDVIPGTKMRLWGFSNDQDISNLLAYLKTFH